MTARSSWDQRNTCGHRPHLHSYSYLCSGAGPRCPFGGGGATGAGISAFPSNANTYMIGGPSTVALFGPTVGAGRPSPPPKATYCFPSTSYVIGGAIPVLPTFVS